MVYAKSNCILLSMIRLLGNYDPALFVRQDNNAVFDVARNRRRAPKGKLSELRSASVPNSMACALQGSAEHGRVSTVVKLSYCPAGRFTGTGEPTPFVSRTAPLQKRFDPLTVLHRKRSTRHVYTRPRVYFFSLSARRKCTPMYSFTLSHSFAQNFARCQNNRSGK
ncbi:hypothetical protein PUN28_014918 [Cardiocondyla obscurior]|uniref:Uncharacterized protein n=1 Tax=Cardiocondyla obscurior TaxID=286306 RepID=A0AAW2EZZ0_9HYME